MAKKECYARLVQFLERFGELVENYPFGGVVTILHDRIMITYPSQEIELAPDGGKIRVTRTTYLKGDCAFECPDKVTERSFASAETAARYIARMQKVPVHVMMNWLKASEA